MSGFVDYLHEVFVELGPISSRKMFGGYGIYHQNLMFGLVADDELYLKTDRDNITQFEQAESKPFEYNKNGKLMKMSYFQAPAEIYDDPSLALEWGTLAFDAALRAASKKTAKKTKTKAKTKAKKKNT